MAKQSTPTVVARGLGGELRQLRKAKRMSAISVANQLGWQPSRLSRMETGQQGITPEDVASLLVVYGVIGDERKRLLGMAGRSRDRGWWETYGSSLTPWSRTFIKLESEAVRIVNWQPLLVPGLLQTPEYAHAVMRACDVAEGSARTRVAARLGRQALLARADPPELHAIVDEVALLRPLGGPRVMARQLRHLVRAAESPTLTISVLPAGVGGHTGLDGPFVILDFARAPAVVHLEHKMSSVFLEAEDQVVEFRHAADRLAKMALTPARSVEFIARIAADHERE
nr:helix-turn-helix transcriptional regulator [Micromonospora sp. DSM 115978]